MKKILIIGATSAIAEATARIWAREKHRFFLIARNGARLESLAADLVVRGAESTDTLQQDLDELDRHSGALDRAAEFLGEIDIVLIAHGTLADQAACEQDVTKVLPEFHTNAISVISLLTHLANRLENQGHGSIAVISSVAGDRGRKSNYVYGAAKGAVTIFLQGMRQRLLPRGIHVMTVKPGLVDTPMTRDFSKGLLWASPDTIGRIIADGVARGRQVVYAPSFWRWIMAGIRWLPETSRLVPK
jgi:short-subunit dehydrogenase